MKKKKIVTITVALIISIIFIIRVVYVNVKYNDIMPHKIVYKYGEQCTYKDVVYQVKDWKVYDSEDEAREYIGEGVYDIYEGESKVVIVAVDVTYIGDADTYKLSLSNKHIQSGGWTNGIIRTARFSSDRELVKGETKTIYLYVNVSNTVSAISPSEFSRIDKRKFEFVLSTYPDIIIMECQ